MSEVGCLPLVPGTTRVASTSRTGLPHEMPVGGKKADIAVTVVQAPTHNCCRLHEREGVSALCLDVTIVHPFTGKGPARATWCRTRWRTRARLRTPSTIGS